MKPAVRFLSVFAATLVAFVSASQAQLVTYQTVSNYAGTNQYSIPDSDKAGQTFSNILAISSLTYNFFNNGASSATQLSASFAVWNGSGGPTGFTDANNYTNVVSFGTFTVPAYTVPNTNGWTTLTNGNGTFNTFAQTFNFASLYVTNPSSVYSLLLTNTSGATTTFGVGFATNSFAYGDASIGLGSFTQDYTFAQIVVVPNDGSHSVPITPVPEASTVASLFAAALVTGFATLRVRQRRQLSASPVLA